MLLPPLGWRVLLALGALLPADSLVSHLTLTTGAPVAHTLVETMGVTRGGLVRVQYHFSALSSDDAASSSRRAPPAKAYLLLLSRRQRENYYERIDHDVGEGSCAKPSTARHQVPRARAPSRAARPARFERAEPRFCRARPLSRPARRLPERGRADRGKLHARARRDRTVLAPLPLLL